MIKALTYLLHGFRYLSKVPACDDIGIVKKQVEKSVAVAAFRTEHSGVSSTAGRSHKKHNRIWHCKSCSFYTKALRSR